MWEGVPLVVGGVEDEDVVEEVPVLAVSAEDDEVVVEGVHGVAVAGAGTLPLGLQLGPAELVALGQVDLPDVVEAEAGWGTGYLSAAL